MEYIGQILSEPDPPGINNQRWIDLIREHPNLQTSQPKQGINPFTRKPMLYRAPPNGAQVIVGARMVGTMCWAEDGSNAIVVWGERQVLVPLACGIAESLGARFEEFWEDGIQK